MARRVSQHTATTNRRVLARAPITSYPREESQRFFEVTPLLLFFKNTAISTQPPVCPPTIARSSNHLQLARAFSSKCIRLIHSAKRRLNTVAQPCSVVRKTRLDKRRQRMNEICHLCVFITCTQCPRCNLADDRVART